MSYMSSSERAQTQRAARRGVGFARPHPAPFQRRQKRRDLKGDGTRCIPRESPSRMSRGNTRPMRPCQGVSGVSRWGVSTLAKKNSAFCLGSPLLSPSRLLQDEHSSPPLFHPLHPLTHTNSTRHHADPNLTQWPSCRLPPSSRRARRAGEDGERVLFLVLPGGNTTKTHFIFPPPSPLSTQPPQPLGARQRAGAQSRRRRGRRRHPVGRGTF